jgi:glycosyltransferase involved in cell wall biosynthesis
MRILCLIDSLGSGGAQRQLATLAAGLKRRGHELRFVVYRPEDHFLPLLLEAGITHELVPPGSYVRRALVIRRILRDDRQDVVLSFLEAPNLYASLAAIPSRTWGLVLGERSAHPGLARGRQKWLRQTYRLADAIVCNSHTNRLMLEAAFRFVRGKVVTIYNTVDLQRFHPRKWEGKADASPRGDPFNIVVAASYRDNKNMMNVAKALLALKNDDRCPPVLVDWYGDTPSGPASRDQVSAFIAECELHDWFRLHAASRDIDEELATADAAGLFSFVEGLPNSICEAMACGKPIVLSEVCDASGLVRNAENGLLCDPDSPDDIADKLKRLATMNTADRAAMGRESRSMAESLFAEATVLDRYERLLAAAARRESPPPSCQWPPGVPDSALTTIRRWKAGESRLSQTPLRVCLVSPMPPPYGGVPNWVLLLQKYASGRGGLQIECVDTGARWRAVDDLALWKRILGGGLQLVRDYVRFLRILQRGSDVVHLNTSARLAVVRDVLMLWTAQRKHIPTVYHLHFGRAGQIAAQNSREWRALTRAMRLATIVIALDQETAATIRSHVPRTRVINLPNAFDPDELPTDQTPANPHTAIFLGWVIPTKGVAELVEAWAGMDTRGWRCVIAGSGSVKYREDLLRRFAPTQLEFLPEQSHQDALCLLAGAAIFVLPSHTEGFPNSVIEAMALGKAIIATEVGAIPEMLSGDCGIVIPPRDVTALRTALETAIADKALREALGRRARDKAETEYNMDKVFERLIEVWTLAALAGS